MLSVNCFTYDRSKRGLFHRANWNANTYRWAMSEVVFALYDIIPDDNNKLSRLFAAFLSVYMKCSEHAIPRPVKSALASMAPMGVPLGGGLPVLQDSGGRAQNV